MEARAVGFKDLLNKNPFKKQDRRRRSRPSARDDDELSAEDLIVLERYDEAEAKLKARLKQERDDLHAHLKLAEVYLQQRRGEDAVQEFVFVAEEYARDGFYDKGVALLGKAARLVPTNDTLRQKAEALKMAKRLESKRAAAVEGMRKGGASGGAWAMEVQRHWHRLAASPLVRDLPEEQLERLMAAMILSRWDEGMVVARQGETTEELHLVLSGVLEARWVSPAAPQAGPREGAEEAQQGGEGGETAADSLPAGTSLRTFSGGDVVGESVLFERAGWPATYLTLERTVLLTLSRLGLQQLLVGNPDPRRLLDSLRRQGNDGEVIAIVRRLG